MTDWTHLEGAPATWEYRTIDGVVEFRNSRVAPTASNARDRARWAVGDVRHLGPGDDAPMSGDHRPLPVEGREYGVIFPGDAYAAGWDARPEPSNGDLFEAIRSLHIVSLDRIDEVIEAVRGAYAKAAE